ncbi:cytoglobin-2 [Folsomia candida]|uniref:Cytoglobin-2 n=1 Tax=Folsomia candida TaxID=158441 RepID=A0A226EHG5_FOLCA|nr:cytoglobin-2 [Folsomia candida]XP_035704850.1 cytoglobin-2 [Folsomia candida]XP_035704851.1 cytoglobin-2 [Folsomia candida]OXA57113.1 Cytoglobin-2 [Folsomia candida]
MGNAIVRQESESSDHPPPHSTPHHPPSLPPRKHSTVSSQARLLLCGPPPVEWLTEEQKIFIRTSWKLIEADISRVGVITFVSLFETHPDVKEVFLPFNGIKHEELQHSKQLRAHALRVMAFVQKAVARLDEKEKLDKLLEELGKAHFYYGAPKKYIDHVGPQFIKAIEPVLSEIWSSDLKDSWMQLFAYITHHMRTAITLAEKAKRGSK